MPCASLYQACHLDGLAHSCMPDANAANTLATKIEQLRKKNITQPFVYVQLEDFLPEWCHGAQLDSDGEVEGSAVKKARAKKRLTALQWTAAFDRHIHCLVTLCLAANSFAYSCRYAIASAVAGQWSYADAMAHKNVVLKVSPLEYWYASVMLATYAAVHFCRSARVTVRERRSLFLALCTTK